MFKDIYTDGGGIITGFVQLKLIKLCINTCICLFISYTSTELSRLPDTIIWSISQRLRVQAKVFKSLCGTFQANLSYMRPCVRKAKLKKNKMYTSITLLSNKIKCNTAFVFTNFYKGNFTESHLHLKTMVNLLLTFSTPHCTAISEFIQT